MLKQTIECEDYSGNKQKIDCYFNINEAELIELKVSKNEFGTYDDWLKRIYNSKDAGEIFHFLEKVVLLAYGEKTDDMHFRKSAEITEGFKSSPAYPAVLKLLLESDNKSLEFVKSVFPKSVSDALTPAAMAKAEKELSAK